MKTLGALAIALVVAPASAQEGALALPLQVSHSYNLDNDLSPDGSQMVYLVYLEGRTQMFVMDAEGRNSRMLFDDDAEAAHEDPTWSPAGDWIAFVRTVGDTRRIAVVRTDGTGFRVLTSPDERAIHPNWNADGTRLLYSTDDDLDPPRKNHSVVYVLDVATGQRERLLDSETRTYLSWSPDGSRIAYRRMNGLDSEVYVANADGTGETNLTNHPAFDGWPEWSPDGSRIAFASNRGHAYQIHVMDADGSNVRLVANTEGRATVPRWSPDGSRIWFTNCWHVGLRRACEIFAADLPQ